MHLLLKGGLVNNAKYLIRPLIILGTCGLNFKNSFRSNAVKNHGGLGLIELHINTYIKLKK